MTSSSSQTIQNSIFPNIPRDKKVVNSDGTFTPLWELYFQQLSQALQNNYRPSGIVVPQQVASNITLLTPSVYVANILYDSTNNVFKGNENGTWKTFTLV